MTPNAVIYYKDTIYKQLVLSLIINDYRLIHDALMNTHCIKI